jgi:hypothetical protein
MILRNILILSLLLIYINLLAQIPRKRLPQNINVPTYSHIFPSLSGDGNQMIYLTNYTNSEGFETKYTIKNGAESWEDPEPISSINRPGQDHIGSFCLSYDGNYVVFSSRRSPSIGNFDIFISERKGNYWSQPQNPGKPLNSPANEGNPSLSPDGKSIYFTRCEKMNNTTKDKCTIYVSHRISSLRWSEPEKLPEHINAGHETTPRIMADNKTLVFASGRPGGKGKLDLYQATLQYGTWSRPVALSYINTVDNDEYVSIPARGDVIYFTGTYRDHFNIYKAIIPQEFRPQKVLMLAGDVSYPDGQKPSEDVIIQAYDLRSGEVFTTTRLRQNDNRFTIFLPEGAKYDISAFPQKGGHTYFSRIINLETMLISKKEELSIKLEPITSGTKIPLSTIRFKDYTSDLAKESDIELKRIIGFLKKNPGLRLEIGAFIDSVYMDTIPSNDLTEVNMDTVFFTYEKADPVREKEIKFEDLNDSSFNNHREQELDSALSNNHEKDSLVFEETFKFEPDSNDVFRMETEPLFTKADSLSSLGFSIFEENDEKTIYYKINYTYHNDRTKKQAEAIMNQLIEAGVPPNLMKAQGYGDNWLLDRAEEERNYWIELKLLR